MVTVEDAAVSYWKERMAMESPEQLMMIFGAVFLIAVTVLSDSLRKPPRDGGAASKGDKKKHEEP